MGIGTGNVVTWLPFLSVILMSSWVPLGLNCAGPPGTGTFTAGLMSNVACWPGTAARAAGGTMMAVLPATMMPPVVEDTLAVIDAGTSLVSTLGSIGGATSAAFSVPNVFGRLRLVGMSDTPVPACAWPTTCTPPLDELVLLVVTTTPPLDPVGAGEVFVVVEGGALVVPPPPPLGTAVSVAVGVGIGGGVIEMVGDTVAVAGNVAIGVADGVPVAGDVAVGVAD